MIATLGLAFLAGVLSVLSPCVLPLLPIVLGTAASEHRLGPVALAVGLGLSFVTIGLFVASIGFAAGLDTDVFRAISAALLIAVGLVLLMPKLQAQFTLAASPVGNWVDERLRIGHRRQGRESRPGRAHHVRLRTRRRSAADAARASLARGDDALARQ